MPAWLVKLISQARGATSSSTSANRSDVGMLRSAYATPPAPTVSWPIRPWSQAIPIADP